MNHAPQRSPFGGRFADAAPYAREAELRFAAWCRREEIAFLDTSRLDNPRAAPPRLVLESGTLPFPDFVLASDGRTALAEVKRHSRTSFHRATRQEVTGIEERYWKDYLVVSACTGLPIFIAFEHDEGPPGFVGGEVSYLRSPVSHRHSGMIFWPVKALWRINTRDDLGFLPHDMRQEEPPDDLPPDEVADDAGFRFGGWQ